MGETQTMKPLDGELSAARKRSKSQRRDPAYEAALGARIRAARIAAKMSQTDLGKAIGISFQQVQKYEKGSDRVSASTLQGIAAVFGVHPGSFYGDDMPVPIGEIAEVKSAMRTAERIHRIRNPVVLKRLLALVDLLAEADAADEVEQPADGSRLRKADPA